MEIHAAKKKKNVSLLSFEIRGIMLRWDMESQNQFSHSASPCFIVSHWSQVPTASPCALLSVSTSFPKAHSLHEII